MRRASVFVCALVGILSIAGGATAQPTFSVDFQGPAAGVPLPDGFFALPITEGAILTTALPGPPGPNPILIGPLPPPGIEIGAAPGAPGAVPGGLGIVLGVGGCDELDALSYGRDAGDQLYFSVDEFATGVPSPAPPNVATEGTAGTLEAAADVFQFLGPLAPTPPGPPIGNTAFSDGDGLAPSGLPGVGFLEPDPPTPGLLPDPGDNLDAVDLDTTFADLMGPIFLSLDAAFADPNEVAPANCGTAVGNGFSPSDLLVTFAGGAPVVAAPAAALGLDLAGFGTDDLDGLVFFDADLSLTLTPPDLIFYTVRRGSAVIGVPDSLFGVPIEPGDVLTLPTAPGLPPSLFIAAEVMGLGTARSLTAGPFGADDVDALDLLYAPSPPVPMIGSWGLGALAVLMFGAPVLAARLHSRRSR
jgi:hypothetical protein